MRIIHIQQLSCNEFHYIYILLSILNYAREAIKHIYYSQRVMNN